MHFTRAAQLLGLLLAPAVLASPISERNSYTCKKDSLYNIFHGYDRYIAEEYCCGLVHYPTVYVTKHVHQTATVTKSSSSTKSLTVTKSSSATKYSTETDTKSVTDTATSTDVSSATTTVTTVPTETDVSTTTTTTEIDTTSTDGITTTTSTTFTSTSVTTSTSTSSLMEPIGKRNGYPWGYGYGKDQLSSACKCLSLTVTETRTVTDVKATSTKAVKVTKSKTFTASVTKTKSLTKSTTTTADTTVTSDVSTTATTTATATSTETDSTTSTSTSTFLSTTITTVASSTETDSTTTTTTTVASATCTINQFYLKVKTSTDPTEVGLFIKDVDYPGNGDFYIPETTPLIGDATPFFLNSAGNIAVYSKNLDDGHAGVTYLGITAGNNPTNSVFEVDPSIYPPGSSNYPLVTCTLVADVITCASGLNTVFQLGGTPRTLFLNQPGQTTGFDTITLQIVDGDDTPILDYDKDANNCPQ